MSINLIAAPPRASLQHYHLSATALRLLDTTVVVPVISIWFIGLYGYQRLRAYTSSVQSNADGKPLRHITRGVMLLAYWLPVSSTSSAILNLYAVHHHSFLAASTIAVNYLSLLFPLVAFWYIGTGSRKLSELSKQRPSQVGVHAVAVVLMLAGVLYGYLVTNARDRIYTIYQMPMVLVLLTLVVPSIFSWYLGVLAAYDMHLYTNKVRGVIYKRSWNTLAVGVVWVLVLSIGFQYLTTVSARLGHLSLGWILTLIYTALPIMAVGYVLIALGAKKLMKIEEA